MLVIVCSTMKQIATCTLSHIRVSALTTSPKPQSPLDANNEYRKIDIEEPHRDQTAFTFHDGLFRFICKPFGLRNVPNTFKRTKDVILATTKSQLAFGYKDDKVVFSETPGEHIHHIKEVPT